MMQSGPALRFRVFLEHRKVDYPQWRPTVGNQPTVFAHFHPQCAERVIDDARLVRAKEDQVAGRRLRAFENARDNIIGQELEDRRLQALGARVDIIDLDVGEPARTETADVFRVIVNDLATHVATAWHTECGDAALRIVGRTGKYLEVDRSHEIAHFDEFALINNTDTLYPEITLIPYPKAGTTNSAARIGVVGATGGEIRWMDVPGDSRNTYIARMDWCDDSETLILQHLNRLQNTNDVLLADAATGEVRRAHQDRSDTWVDVMDDLEWLEGSEEFVWLSEKDGWRHAYRVRRDGGGEKLITPFEADVISLVGTGSGAEWLYFIASPANATQRFLYRAKVDGSGRPERVTPTDQPGSHSYDLSPDGAYAFHTYSRFDVPPVVDLVRLPEHETVRVLEDNAALASKLSDIVQPPVEFFQTEVEPGLSLDSWMLEPRDFEPSQSYPLLVFVYGEPAGTTVVDRWGGERMLFHRALADEGFVVVSFDNRGTPAPKGAAWRKVVYGTVGEHSSRDQAAAVRAFSEKHSFVDPERVAVWGWSGGGSNTLNCMFRYPEVFKVGVSVAPVPDQRLYDTIYQERYMGLPDDNAQGYEIGSPIHFAAGLEGRLLLVHGTADDNVHYQGTERLVNRLIELGKPFDMMVYPNRTHAIKEGDGTRFHVYSLIARYLTEARW